MSRVVTDPVLRRAMGEVSERAIEADPRVKAARKAWSDAEKRHGREVAAVTAFDRVFAGAEEMASRAREQFKALTDQLPTIYAGVIVGDLTPADEGRHLEELAAVRHIFERWDAARPLLEARRKEVRAIVAPYAGEATDRQSELEQVREDVREELARATL